MKFNQRGPVIGENKQTVRRAILLISPTLLVDMFREGNESHFRVEQGLPEDVRWLGVYYDPIDGNIQVALESESFPLTIEGCAIPILNPPMISLRTDCPAYRERLTEVETP